MSLRSGNGNGNGNGNDSWVPFAERRRHLRAKVSLRVHIRGGVGTLEVFEDMGSSMDVSRDGVQLATARGGYWVGQWLQVTCPYWNAPNAINFARRAKVVRNTILPDFRHAIALQFATRNGNGDGLGVATPFVNQVRVLGVGAESNVAREAGELLKGDGYQVVHVSTAQQALDILRDETPDVLIAEAEGGEISGKDLCAIVKKDERLQHIPVILLTRSALPSDYASGYDLGAIMCMMNPCSPGRLQNAVHVVAPPPSQRSVYSGNFNLAAYSRTS